MKINYSQAQINAAAINWLKTQGFRTDIDNIKCTAAGMELHGHRFIRSEGEDVICQYDWPIDVYVQGDTSIDTLADNDAAFFEAYPTNPSTWVRGEGATLLEAETQAWTKYQAIMNCPGHEFDRHPKRVDGYAECKHCHLTGILMPPVHPCAGCGATEYKQEGTDKNYKGYCAKCLGKLPDDMMPDFITRSPALLARMRKKMMRLITEAV